MRTTPATLLALCILLVATGVAGCGEEGGEDGGSEQVSESVDPLPKLPKGWKPHVNRDGGFAIGVPPRWSARARRQRSELRSLDRLVAVSIAADRTAETLAVPLPDLARATMRAGLPGVRNLDPGKPKRFPHRYDAVSLVARGVAGKPPVEERLTLVVIRRKDVATYTVLVAENTEVLGRPYRGEIERTVRSLRGRPIGARPGAGQRSGRSG